jgi:thymidylate synthase (FAD)
MKAEFVHNTQNDLMIANVARVSFDNWNEELDMTLNAKGNARDPNLIKYLADHKHISPFFHVRKSMILPIWAIDLYAINDPTYLMGAVWEKLNNNHIKLRTSYYGWIKLVQDKIIDEYFAYHVHTMLREEHALYHANKAFKLNPYPTYHYGAYTVVPEENNPQFIDYSMRINCSIPMARQMFTHRMFVSNEMSRRYVDTPPEFYTPTEWRLRPDGSIKQGSAGVWSNPYFWTEEFDDVDVPIEEVYAYYLENSKELYTDMINKGIAPEQARFVLPQAMETSFIFTGSAASWSRMIKLRLDSHAQLEIRDLAKMIFTELVTNDPKFLTYYLYFEENNNNG